jgi:hypothetical protein
LATFIQFLKHIRNNRQHGASWSDVFLFSTWKKNLQPGVSSVSAQLPWISIRAVDFLNREVRSDFQVFEYGGGGSTLYWNSRVKKVVTVEHDASWFAVLKETMEKNKKCEWTGLFIEPAMGDLVAHPDASEPDHYSSNDEASKGKNYQAYVQSVLSYADESFDVILIDGRSRTSCIRDAFPKLKKDGLLILDNAERLYYSEKNQEIFKRCFLEVKGMGPVYFSPHFSETRIYRKLS